MANRYVLGADIRVTGNYKSQLNTFLNSIKRCEREFDSFTQKVVKDTKAIETSLNQMTKNVSQYANKISKNEKDAVNKSNALQEKMSKSVDRLGDKYEKLGKQIKDAYSNIPLQTPKMSINTNGKSGVTSVTGGGGDSASFSFISSFKSMLLGFVSLQTAIKAIQFYLKTANEIANKISNGIINLGANLLKTTGLTPNEMVTNAMDFEQIRATMNVLAKSEEKGAEVYKNATMLAKRTSFTEADTTEMAQYILKANLLPTEGDLEQLANMASLKPELGAGHAGFSVFDWLNGLTTSLKRNYGIDNEVLINYLKTLPDEKDFSKAFTKKGAVGDKEQAFNLLMRYIDSNYKNLAYTQSNTLKGRLSTIEGQFMQYGSDLMGLDSTQGIITNENGVYSQLLDFLGKYSQNPETGESEYTGLMGSLNSIVSSDAFKNLEDALGGVAKSILDIINVAIQSDNLEKFTDMLANIGKSVAKLGEKFKDLNIMQEIIDVIIKVGNEFADLVKTFAESEQYEQFLKQLPDLIEQSLELEMAKAKLAMSLSAHSDTIMGVLDKITGFLDWIAGASDVGSKYKGNYYAYEDKAILSGENSGVYGWMPGFKNSTRDVTLHDEGLVNWLEEQGTLYMSQDDKDKVKNYINNDSKTTYDIQLQYHNGKYDREQLVSDLLALLDEADSNN